MDAAVPALPHPTHHRLPSEEAADRECIRLALIYRWLTVGLSEDEQTRTHRLIEEYS